MYKASADTVLCAAHKKGNKTKTLIAPTDQRLREARTQKKRLILGAMSAQLNQPRSRTRNSECLGGRFPPLWSVEELDACFVVRDHNGQKLACVYFENEPGRRSAAKLLITRDDPTKGGRS